MVPRKVCACECGLNSARAAAAAIALQFVDAYRDDRSFGQWLARHGQGEWARRAFWDLLSLSALNVEADRADLPLAVSTKDRVFSELVN